MMMPTERTSNIRHFGKHAVWAEEPETLAIRFGCDIDPHSYQALLDFQHEWSRGKTSYFLLCDLSALRTVHASSLRQFHIFRKDGPPVTVACFGASFAVRVAAEMSSRALKALNHPAPSTETRFFATEAEARAFIGNARRNQL
jgi:hypothetical protein